MSNSDNMKRASNILGEDVRYQQEERLIMDYCHQGKTHDEIGELINRSPDYVHDVVVHYWWKDKNIKQILSGSIKK